MANRPNREGITGELNAGAGVGRLGCTALQGQQVCFIEGIGMPDLLVRRGEKVLGPFPPDKIKQMITDDKIKLNDLIRIEGDDQWNIIGDIPNLAKYFSKDNSRATNSQKRYGSGSAGADAGRRSRSAKARKPAWHVRDPDGQAVGPITRRQLQEMCLAGEISSSTEIRHVRWPDWRPATQLFPDVAQDDWGGAAFVDTVGDISGLAARVFTTLRNHVRFEWTPSAPQLRRCTKCHRNQFTSPQYCQKCGATTLGLGIADAESGRDLAEQKCAAYASTARRRLGRTTGACFGIAILLLAVALATVNLSVVILLLFLVVTLLSPFLITAIRNQLFLHLTGLDHYVSTDQVTGNTLASFIEPFLKRCDSLASHADSHSGLKLLRLTTLGQATVVVVPDGEIAMLEEVLDRNQIRLWNDLDEARRVLGSSALNVDYSLFEERVSALCQSGNDVFTAFVSLMKDDDTLVPFLQQLLVTEDKGVEVTQIEEELECARNELRITGFARDLEQRQAGSLAVTMQMVDLMDPYDFELLLGMIYETMGYVCEETPKSGDQGADVLIEKAGERTVIQAKKYSDHVGNKAVQEAIAARGHFRCHFAAVVTNNFFTRSAKDLAKTNDVALIDRDQLNVMLMEFNSSAKDYSRLDEMFRENDRDEDDEWPSVPRSTPPPTR